VTIRPPLSQSYHRHHQRAQYVEESIQVGRDDIVPLFSCQRGKGPVANKAGIADDSIVSAGTLNTRRKGRGGSGAIGDVKVNKICGTTGRADVLNDGFCFLDALPAMYRYRKSIAGEPLCNGSTDSSACTCD
jgi:hypothetical protein